MALIDKLRDELDRAGKAAQGAFDEGKTRLEAFRTRQLADKAAQALGYAVFRAKQGGGEIDADTYSRLSATLATHDSEAARYEREVEEKRRGTGAPADAAPTSTAAGDDAEAAGTTSTSSPYSNPAKPTDQDVTG
ncbi:MAG: hypothetical protein ACSLFK_14925 [Gemmatimonadaceae bacterium]